MIQVVLIHSHWSFDQRCLGWGHNLWKRARPCAMWRHAQGRWANHFFAFLHFGSNAAQLPPHKRLASTFQPTMKLVIEPASAILLHTLMQPWRFNGPFWNSVWLLVWFPSAATINGWPQPFNPPWNWWLSQHLPSFCIPWCQPWRFNEPFGNSVWLLVWFSKCCHYKMAGLNLSNPPWSWWLSQHLPSFCIPWCQPWRFNGPFGIACGYLYDFQVLPL